MSPNEIIAFFETMVDDSPDAAAMEVLMDTAYTQVNEERPWAFLMKLDTSIVHSPGNTWQSTKTLPLDFGRPYKLYGGASDNEYLPIPYDRILQYKDSSNRYALDMVNLQARFTGSPSSALTMYMWYLYNPTSLIGLSDVQKAATTTIVWPKRFCPILAFKMAEILLGGIDADNVTRQMTPSQRLAYKELKRAMIQWDNKLRLTMMGNAAGGERQSVGDQSDVVTW